VSGCHYHDLELASAGDGDAGGAGGGGGEPARRLDFQAKRAVGGHKKRLLEGACGNWPWQSQALWKYLRG
jgi:hypothetical protein